MKAEFFDLLKAEASKIIATKTTYITNLTTKPCH